MHRLKTNTAKTVADPRTQFTTSVTEVVRLTVEKHEIMSQNVVVRGKYFFLDDNNDPVVLSQFDSAPKASADIIALENTLPDLTSAKSSLAGIYERTPALTMATLEAQNPKKYGIETNEWVEDNDPVGPQPE